MPLGFWQITDRCRLKLKVYLIAHFRTQETAKSDVENETLTVETYSSETWYVGRTNKGEKRE